MERARVLTSTGVLVVALILAAGCGSGNDDTAVTHRGPEFRLPSLDGGDLGLADFPGKTVLVEFWATWCTPCRAQAKILEEMWAREDRDAVQYLAISVGESEATVRAFVDKNPFPYPVLLDSADELSVQLMIYVLPTVMIVDPEGRIVYFEQGISPASSLRAALGGAAARLAM